MDDILTEFLVESSENLSRLDQDLVTLEKNPTDLPILQTIFRVIHTVKGTGGMLGFARLERVAHAAEDVLSKMRDGALAVTSDTIGPVLTAVDIIKSIISALEQSEHEPAGDDSAAIRQLRGLIDAGAGADSADAPYATPAVDLPTPAATTSPAGERKATPTEQSLRVHIGILDTLMNLVGELVLNRNQLIQLAKKDEESPYINPIQQLSRVTSGLQQAVMKTRMQPIGNAWSKLPRIIRDLEHTTGKKLNLVMIGQDTEIDRQILQAIQDPLVHCVRNSADHGIEAPATRAAHGKSATGTITLRAFHEGGHIIIEIQDDGAGINAESVKRKAVERGLVSSDAAATLTDTQIFRFIFEAGFSTAQQVTEVSGRGVGMDVVRSNIESIGGSVDLHSQLGIGTTVRIKIPLTLAIISALLVKAGDGPGSVFSIPQVGVIELVHIAETNRHLIDDIQGAKMLRLRGRLLPLVRLADVLGIDSTHTLTQPDSELSLSIVVVQVSDRQFGLVVDEVYDTQEIVVKPVGRLLREINLFSGSTILGDGRVVLILDIARIAAHAFSAQLADEQAEQDKYLAQSRMSGDDRTALLIFRASANEHYAVPLALVARLEEFPAHTLERVDHQYVVQYRGALLPLVPSSEQLDTTLTPDRLVTAIVFSDGTRAMGLWVHDFVDITEEPLNLETTSVRPGHLGSSIIAGRATELIDAYYFLKLAYPQWFQSHGTTSNAQRPRILFVEDSKFFQNLLKPLLESKGYDVIMASDGAAGLATLLEHPVDLILSDIEMPVMNGFDMITKIRERPEYQHVPALALTTLADPPNREKGLRLGFTKYLIKFDQDMVLGAIATALTSVHQVHGGAA